MLAAETRVAPPSDSVVLLAKSPVDWKQIVRPLEPFLQTVSVRMAEQINAFEPDLIVLDVGLPCSDGYEVARRLRREPGGAELLLIALTGYGQEDDRRRTEQAGFDHHLVKPADPQALY